MRRTSIIFRRARICRKALSGKQCGIFALHGTPPLDILGGNPYSLENNRADQTVSVPGNTKRLIRARDGTRDLRQLGIKKVTEPICQANPKSESKILLPGVNEYFLRYAHSSNVRTEKLPMSRPDYPYWRPIPYSVSQCRISGRTESAI